MVTIIIQLEFTYLLITIFGQAILKTVAKKNDEGHLEGLLEGYLEA